MMAYQNVLRLTYVFRVYEQQMKCQHCSSLAASHMQSYYNICVLYHRLKWLMIKNLYVKICLSLEENGLETCSLVIKCYAMQQHF
jgi:hypothetical protein